jgi:hypothetical protein
MKNALILCVITAAVERLPPASGELATRMTRYVLDRIAAGDPAHA